MEKSKRGAGRDGRQRVKEGIKWRKEMNERWRGVKEVEEANTKANYNKN